MFYWIYYTTANVSSFYDRPLIIWLQGGPSTSAVGYGNFEEIGPLDSYGKPRETTWVKDFNILFVDSPVGSGWSFVDDEDYLHCETNREVAQDLVAFLRQFYRVNPLFKATPFHIFGEGYGGKMAAEFANLLNFEITQGLIEVNLQSLVIGNPWVSPVDSVLSWAPFLYYMGYIDIDGYENVMDVAEDAADAAYYEEWLEATSEWATGEAEMIIETDGINFDNILKAYKRLELPPEEFEVQISKKKNRRNTPHTQRNQTKSLLRKNSRKTNRLQRKQTLKSIFASHTNFNNLERSIQLWTLMNGPVAETLGINRTWWGNREAVFYFLEYDFMKDCLYTVAKLLDQTNIKVIVYTGQLDLNAPTSGAVEWLNEWLDWSGVEGYKRAPRKSVVVDDVVEAYLKQYRNLYVYWVLRAGQKAPVDNPKAIRAILQEIERK